ncbi:unnamed protein product [Protopolystoma xenopodis]|uniref:Uncharacterized protein n=1 Tax=Protopolystoma xenopodis TaxID=117903 RepID=A0A3S5CLK0_9PLAT|nr:unnamed protein product [Protopolystoma xenopodis]
MTSYNNQCARGQSVLLSLKMLQNLEKLPLPGFSHEMRYKRLFAAFRNEIEEIAQNYSQNALNPPLGRDIPPNAGEYS